MFTRMDIDKVTLCVTSTIERNKFLTELDIFQDCQCDFDVTVLV